MLLLHRHAPFEFWQSVTGSLNRDESVTDAAGRELAEETGLRCEGVLTDAGIHRVFTIDRRWRDRYAQGVTENTEYEWRYRLAGVRDIAIDNDEHVAYCWRPIEEAIEIVWSWTNKEALRSLHAELQQNTLTV